MPEYLYPGVYVEEIDTGNKPIEGVSTSTVGFLGIAERGPTEATFITSYADFQRSFGSYFTDSKGNQAYLAYAVEGFFLNGGLRCWIARATSATAVRATKTSGALTIAAAGPGTKGNNIAFWISPASIAASEPTRFRLTLYYWNLAADATAALTSFDPKTGNMNPPPTQVEDFDNLSLNPNSSMYFVGALAGASNLVTVDAVAGATPGNIPKPVLLDHGDDGAALTLADFEGSAINPTKLTGLEALKAIDEISLLCCPDEGSQPVIADRLAAACADLKDRFVILQSQISDHDPSKVTPSVNSQRGYAAFYYPWLQVTNPVNNVSILIPPGGHIAGIYARSDTNKNVAKDPANEPIVGVDSLQLPIDNQRQAILNPIGVNCLRYFKGKGNLVWGGRTTSPDPDWKYISVRRLFIFIEKSIQQGTQWVVFEPNDASTWARVRRTISDFLTGLWMQDMLQGATKEQAFFVRCDNTTMTQADIENGRLIVVIGVAPVYPAEFVIFRIGQWSGGSSVTEA